MVRNGNIKSRAMREQYLLSEFRKQNNVV
ncbi:uncharacterized protein G2W53_004679 [Senna tora]|uniref:Uncharacterized protein n=1 Tax=Senna tora TaxID=362788 RepID=A0A835CGN6_9FABA|nr:uncharacterized protein G2W53_004679 [Senna tora]